MMFTFGTGEYLKVRAIKWDHLYEHYIKDIKLAIKPYHVVTYVCMYNLSVINPYPYADMYSDFGIYWLKSL